MRIFKQAYYSKVENPNPGTPFKLQILTSEHHAKELGAIFREIDPGSPGTYHYHNHRETLLVVISGEAIERIEGKEVPIGIGDILYIPAGEKHTLANRSTKSFRFLEFFTDPNLKIM